MNPLAVIFDMDGVIVDNADYHFKAWKQTCNQYGISLTEEQYQTQLNGRTMTDTLAILFGRKLSEEEETAFSQTKEALYRELYAPHLKPVPGLLSFLQSLQQAGFPLAVATSAPPDNVTFTLDGTGTRAFFSSIIDASMVSQGKPHPEVYTRSGEALNMPPQNCWVFEDAVQGVKAGKAAGMKVCGISTTHTADKLHEADRIISDFEGLTAEDLFLW